MSTKATLFLNDDFHLYRDAWDNDNVYLEIAKPSEILESLVIKIPIHTWNEMTKHQASINSDVPQST